MMNIRKFQKKDTLSCANLIHETYEKYNGDEYNDKSASEEYARHFDSKRNSLDSLYNEFSRSKIFFVAIDKGEIIGIIRGRKEKISNLFVNGKYHKKGIGHKLVEKFESEAKRLGSKKIKIRSTVYALSFYKRQGYKRTTGLRNYRGLKAYPMKKYLL